MRKNRKLGKETLLSCFMCVLLKKPKVLLTHVVLPYLEFCLNCSAHNTLRIYFGIKYQSPTHLEC